MNGERRGDAAAHVTQNGKKLRSKMVTQEMDLSPAKQDAAPAEKSVPEEKEEEPARVQEEEEVPLSPTPAEPVPKNSRKSHVATPAANLRRGRWPVLI